MIHLIKNLFTKKEESSAFSEFFIESSSREKAKVFKKAARKANEDQQRLVERYEREIANKK